MNLILKISGLMTGLAGLILTCRPALLNAAASRLTGYEMIEVRVKWGVLIGIGIFLFVFQQWGQWGSTIWALLAALTVGIIISRSLGFILDGFFAKQLLWLLIEVILAGVFSYLYWRLNN